VGTRAHNARIFPSWAVHPHARGDKTSGAPLWTGAVGSPPRAWGQVRRECDCRQRRGSPPRAWGQVVARVAGGQPHRFTPTRVGTRVPHPSQCESRPVHPHARGDKLPPIKRTAKGIGSPPRAWGQDLPRTPWRRFHGSPPRAWGQGAVPSVSSAIQRFTPTRVGTRFLSSHSIASRTVHPHARGDKVSQGFEAGLRYGSPPRAWGQGRGSCRRYRWMRFTPTRVGTRRCLLRCGRGCAVHPHARGDKVQRHHRQDRDHGSPPRAWGQGSHTRRCRPATRFTPTRVGTRRTSAARCRADAVHPHARGDKKNKSSLEVVTLGSPPRAWGQVCSNRPTTEFIRFTPTRVGTRERPLSPIAGADRFTPTRVGTSARLGRASTPIAVHPHARGDKLSLAVEAVLYDGSPPRAWGQGLQHQPHTQRLRFTPTRVGTSQRPGGSTPLITVHPHARGDKSPGMNCLSTIDGSPPRAWGQAAILEFLGDLGRFTPTRVGTRVGQAPDHQLLSVHPHARGDKVHLSLSHKRCTGSPPRAWGQGGRRCGREHRLRFTPTRVGTRLGPRRNSRRAAVHPHARGDKDFISFKILG